MKLEYKKALDEDIEIIYRANKELLEQYEDLSQFDKEAVLYFLHKKIEDSIRNYRRIYCEERAAGFYCSHKNETNYEIDDLYLYPEFRNQGIGTKVLDQCIAKADGPVILYVLVKNHRAVSLYERIGFRVAELKNSAYLMIKG